MTAISAASGSAIIFITDTAPTAPDADHGRFKIVSIGTARPALRFGEGLPDTALKADGSRAAGVAA